MIHGKPVSLIAFVDACIWNIAKSGPKSVGVEFGVSSRQSKHVPNKKHKHIKIESLHSPVDYMLTPLFDKLSRNPQGRRRPKAAAPKQLQTNRTYTYGLGCA